MSTKGSTESERVPQELPRNIGKYTARDVLLYALGVGATLVQPNHYETLLCETRSTFQVLPTFGIIITNVALERLFNDLPRLYPFLKGFKPQKVIHGEHKYTQFHPLPVPKEDSIVEVQNTPIVSQVYDKAKAALVSIQVESRLRKNGLLLCRNEFVLYFMGKGGFGGIRGPPAANLGAFPPRDPEFYRKEVIGVDQAALYRLSGDMNPLHIDRDLAKDAGFPAPILHGLCSLGVVVRVSMEEIANGDSNRFHSVQVRFSSPVYPGETLLIEGWKMNEAGDSYRIKVSSNSSTLVFALLLILCLH